jgi:hypothetical protein
VVSKNVHAEIGTYYLGGQKRAKLCPCKKNQGNLKNLEKTRKNLTLVCLVIL